MSATEAATTPAPRKRRANDTIKRTSEDDHRRKRRNRTTQSCLNCHTSKRMCDRKRPCGRCTQLGLTGLCVYEVDDPNQRNDGSDEKSRLQKRVAELESVIRELKNKPHPRWVQALEAQKNSVSARIKASASSSPSRSQSEEATSPTDNGLQLLPLTAPPSSRASPIDTTMSSTSSSASSSYSSPSPLDTPSTPSPLTLSPIDVAGEGAYDLASLLSSCYSDGAGIDGALDSIFDGLIRTEGLGGLSTADSCLIQHDSSHVEGHCGCLSDTSSYNVVLELSLRLRRAAETLSQFPKHRAASSCPIHQRITELDRCTTEVLGNVNSATSTLSPYGVPVPNATAFAMQNPMTSRGQALAGTISPQSLHSNSRQTWEYKAPSYPTPPSEDSFMSWEPHRRSTEWSP